MQLGVIIRKKYWRFASINGCLVLNASYEPLNITSWRAIVLLIKGKAEQVEHNGKYLYSDFPANRYPAASLCSFLIRKFSDPPQYLPP